MPESDNINIELTAFVHENGYTFALVFPEEWRFPYEYVDIGEAYPTRIEYIQSNRENQTDWYQNGVESGIAKLKKPDWAW
jgi:LruC domain-containing protein